MIKSKKFILSIIIIILLLSQSLIVSAEATDIELIVDEINITDLSSPVIKNDRLLVPLRVISDQIGASVTWDGEKRAVTLIKDKKKIFLWIGSRLVKYNDGQIYNISDVAPIIINDRTYVPLRLISNGLNIKIKWDGENRKVIIDSSQTSELESFYDLKITSHKNGSIINGKTEVNFDIPDSYKDKAKEIRLMVLNPETAKGNIVASTNNFKNTLTYLPKVEDFGHKVLVLGIYDKNRKFIGGDSIGIEINVNPEVKIVGLSDLPYKNKLTINQEVNFLAHHIQYEIKNVRTGKTQIISERDPFGYYNWMPTFEENGNYEIKVIAYDSNGNSYSSALKTVTFNVDPYLYMGGVSSKRIIKGPVNLIASRNFDVTNTQYWITNLKTGISELIAEIPYGSYKWTPADNYMGEKEFYVKVTDVKGNLHTSNPVKVTIDNRPYISLVGIGPNQVLTTSANLSVKSNVILNDVTYIIKNEETASQRILAEGLSSNEIYKFSPLSSDGQKVTIYARGNYKGQTLTSKAINFKIYLGKLYSSKPIIEKNKYLDFASNLAIDSYNKTGMSAALQTAQAILETGWGQSIPVDKYTGQFSYNLFGIKGTGNNGSVTCNTWEVYNGVTFKVDADFRAYNNVNESWNDHKRILLELSRYEPYRAVMYDSTLGAWAIRRAGYATDPKYPIKLMNIIKQYNLETLDEIGI